MRQVESERKMRPLIADRSCLKTTSEREKSPSQTEGESHQDLNYLCHNASAALTTSPDSSLFPMPIFILSFTAIVLPIATIFGDFNTGINVVNGEINNEFKEKSGLINGTLLPQTQTQTSHPTAVANDTVFDFNPIGAGLREFVINGSVFDVVINENKFYYVVNNVFDCYLNENFNDTDINVYYFVPPGMFVFCFFIFPKIRSI